MSLAGYTELSMVLQDVSSKQEQLSECACVDMHACMVLACATCMCGHMWFTLHACVGMCDMHVINLLQWCYTFYVFVDRI